MRKMIMMLIASAAVVSAGAQNRSDRIAISAGALVERGLDATLSWEHETTYHNAWEFFANSYLQWDKCPVCGTVCDESFFHNYNNWTAGFAWKPCILRFRNNYGSLRLGASAGTDTERFIAGLHAGYEHDYALRHGWRFFWSARADVMFPDKSHMLRAGVSLGIKFPSFNRTH